MNPEKAFERLKDIHDEHRFLLETDPYRLLLVQESLSTSVPTSTLHHKPLEKKLIEDKIFDDPTKKRYGGYFMILHNKPIFWGPSSSIEPATKKQFDEALATGDIIVVNAAGELVAR